MRIIHLSKEEFTSLIVLLYSAMKEADPNFKAHQDSSLWNYIKMAEMEFPELKWREDLRYFQEEKRVGL